MPDFRLGREVLATREKPSDDAIEQYRMNSNAFYQQHSIRRRNATTPSGMDLTAAGHESFTGASANSTPLSVDTRVSDITTMSPFVNAGPTGFCSPPIQRLEQLKLVPDDQQYALPTSRAIIEDRREHMEWNASSQESGRTPVYNYTSQQADATNNNSNSSKGGGLFDGFKSPKKRFMDRFAFGRTKSVSKTNAHPLRPTEAVGPKAAAVLGTPVKFGKKVDSLMPISSAKEEKELRDRINEADQTGSRYPVNVAPFSRGDRAPTLKYSQEVDTDDRRVVSQLDKAPTVIESVAAYCFDMARNTSLHHRGDEDEPPMPPSKDTPLEQKCVVPYLKTSNTTSQSDTPHHRYAQTVFQKTPLKPQIGPHASDSPSSHKSESRSKRHQIVVVDNAVSVQAMRGVLVTEDGGITTEEKDIVNAEKATYATLGLLEDGGLPQSTYSDGETPARIYQTTGQYSPSIYDEDMDGNPIAKDETSGAGPASSYQIMDQYSPSSIYDEDMDGNPMSQDEKSYGKVRFPLLLTFTFVKL